MKLALLVSLLFVSQAVWTPFERQILPVLDTQTGVVNTTGCAWNDQDVVGDINGSDLLAGESTSDTLCLVADYDDSGNVSSSIYPKAIALRVNASSSAFVATIRNDVGSLWTLPLATKQDRRYKSELCVSDPVAEAANSPDPLWSYWPQVSGTTGYGQIVRYTATITASKRLNKLEAIFEIHAGGNGAASPRYLDTPCPEPDGL